MSKFVSGYSLVDGEGAMYISMLATHANNYGYTLKMERSETRDGYNITITRDLNNNQDNHKD